MEIDTEFEATQADGASKGAEQVRRIKVHNPMLTLTPRESGGPGSIHGSNPLFNPVFSLVETGSEDSEDPGSPRNE